MATSLTRKATGKKPYIEISQQKLANWATSAALSGIGGIAASGLVYYFDRGMKQIEKQSQTG